MSDTPRTDALLNQFDVMNPKRKLSHGEWYELCNHARALERECRHLAARQCATPVFTERGHQLCEAEERFKKDMALWRSRFSGAIQGDLESGVRWLNDRAALNFKDRYPGLHAAITDFLQGDTK
jgi:hypothetical protein